ncbi:thiamine pyrophosphate-dependent enzyme [Marispirochaeta aestuarii]|uniref:thiamine pyrophosphate-dependent enzyme n=1 Tax=Marispirochaeta aestuarii TaxID=1963862 RepID=UPI0029C8F82E|nr:thiamine pyrophosphate-dependent enzyme [Marispirochaeta aestuarii]
MSDIVLLGDEAVALGAVHAGISAAYGYPGTPSTEILEFLIDYKTRHGAPHAAWCSNEKTAYEDALGVSFVGKRVLVTMKHVGLNVAADPFVNSGLLNIRGGLVLAVADDPGMHSSQNEQDSRFFADFAKIICLEPRNQQETYEMTLEAFELSEKFHIPVMLRLVTRLAHSRAIVKVGAQRDENSLSKPEEKRGWMLLPATARQNYQDLLKKEKEMFAWAEDSARNPLENARAGKRYPLGIITSGLGRNYYDENLPELSPEIPRLHISAYPLPRNKIRPLAAACERIMVIEEGYPLIEEKLKGILEQDITISGKLDGTLPRTGELTPDAVRRALGLEARQLRSEPGMELPGRPPQLCQGCPHIDTYKAINEAIGEDPHAVITSDIGCYALGALPPYRAIETIVCMGASIGMAKGAAEAGVKRVVATIGDSTFLHSGITSLVDAAAADAPMTVIILDNGTVGMTGGQETILPTSRVHRMIEGLEIDPAHIRSITPLKKNAEENRRIIAEEIDHPGLSVIVSIRECIETAKRDKKKAAQEGQA